LLARVAANTRPDWIAILIFAFTAILLMLSLIEGGSLDWPWWLFAMIAAVVTMVLAFVASERHRSAQGHFVPLPPGLLSNAPSLKHLVLITLFFAGIRGPFFVPAIFLQSGFGLTASQSGLVMTRFHVGVMLASLTTQQFKNRFLLGGSQPGPPCS